MRTSLLTEEERKARRRASRLKWKEANPEKHKASVRKCHLKFKQKRLEYSNAWRIKNRDKVLAQRRIRRPKNKERYAPYNREYRKKNKLRIAARWREYHETNQDKIRERQRVYYASNREVIHEREKKRKPAINRKYRQTHADKIRVTVRDWKRRKQLTCPRYRMENALRGRLRKALTRNIKKVAPTMELLGCTPENLWLYLESKFETGMTRENYGKVWELDHIMPCAIFDLTKPEHQRRCFHFSNLQPLFASENRKKSAKVITNQFNLI